jgi:hypothetical protein
VCVCIPRSNLANDETGDLLGDPHNIFILNIASQTILGRAAECLPVAIFHDISLQ